LSRERALLPGVAALHRRRPRSDRDAQRGPDGHLRAAVPPT